ncbi:unnamed protein product [Didymodactylos carnosus]|uniref:Nucleotide-diphospho-sugar transferase domain-containing protein n=1 Tax=Didymodactylos carnosus TaxID=1234261 RepID=A0A8S2IUV6_9BILA|nr:unnamed protein product [Didymodactylos carnosus]CAF3762648.1 unnamed protein product [Didymodactylos carnosus]
MTVRHHLFQREPQRERIGHEAETKNAMEPFEFIVFNDGYNINTKFNLHAEQASGPGIDTECARLGIEHHRVPWTLFDVESTSDPSWRTYIGLQYALDMFAKPYPGYVVLMDSDMFWSAPFSVKEYLKGHAWAAIPQTRSAGNNTITYVYNGILLFNMMMFPYKAELNFKLDGYDPGGYTRRYLSKHPDAYPRWIPHVMSQTIRTDQEIINLNLSMRFDAFLKKELSLSDGALYSEVIFEGRQLYHYRSGSNWNMKPPSYHKERFRLLSEFLTQYLTDKRYT